MQERYLALTEKRKIPEVIVVEGKDDTANLRRFYEVDTYETRGSAINEDDLERIDKLNELRGVIVFTDEYNREFPIHCHIESLVKSTLASSPIPHKSKDNPPSFIVLFSKS